MVATRQERVDAFNSEGEPPPDYPVELLCEDHVGTYVLPFPCRWTQHAWQNMATGQQIECKVLGWRTTAERWPRC